MFKIFGARCKKEERFVRDFMERHFQSNDIKAYALVGFNSLQARDREVDLILIVSFDENGESSARSLRTRKEHKELRYEVDKKEKTTLPSNHMVFLNTLIFSIEIKSHDTDGIVVEGPDIYVKYPDKMECPTAKLKEQANTVRKLLIRQFGFPKKFTRVISMIYFPSIAKNQFREISSREPGITNCTLFGNTTRNELFKKAVMSEGVRGDSTKRYSEIGLSKFSLYQKEISERFRKYYRGLKPSHIEQEKLEILSRKYVEDRKKWVNTLGDRPIAFTGRAGTGKTLRLLSTCVDLVNDHMEPVLFLTFNAALATDLRRLMQLQRISSGTQIAVKTIDEFLFEIARRMDLYDEWSDFTKDMLDTNLYEMIRDCVNEGLNDEGKKKKIDEDFLRNFNYIAIDEAQDWFDNEREIILKLFDPKRVLLAAGTDQCLRAPRLANWTGDVRRRDSEIYTVPGKVALRQFSNLSLFCNSLSEKMQLEWAVKKNEELLGGDIYLYHKLDGEVMKVLLSEWQTGTKGYEPIDYMMLGSASADKKILTILKDENISYWNAIDKTDRKRMPSIDEIRCVSIEACRGLEAWATLITDLDTWFEFCLRKGKPSLSFREDISFEEKEFLNRKQYKSGDYRFLPTWFLIPLTRAKGRMLIEMPRNQEICDFLQDLHDDHHEFIHMIN